MESRRGVDRTAAEALVAACLPYTAKCLRIGLSGTPGVGKSTFIEALGCRLVDQGRRLAVLAVDPSSSRSGGSILGDKTRMDRLARSPNAFIRPSPSNTELGGVARRTREAAILCAAAGFEIVLIETVGVGQSETMVAQMTDLFVLLVAPAAGDELQGVKRGIMEVADLVLVNKADGELESQATRTCADYAGALRLFRARQGDAQGFPKAMMVSAQTGRGMEDSWDAMSELSESRRASGYFAANRERQARDWFLAEVRAGLLARLEDDPEIRDAMKTLGEQVADGTIAPHEAARSVLEQLL